MNQSSQLQRNKNKFKLIQSKMIKMKIIFLKINSRYNSHIFKLNIPIFNKMVFPKIILSSQKYLIELLMNKINLICKIIIIKNYLKIIKILINQLVWKIKS